MKNSFKNVSTWASWGDTSQVVKQLTPKHPNPFWHPQEASNIHRLAGQTGVGTCQSRILLLSPVSDISLFFARTTWLILSSTSLPGILHVAITWPSSIFASAWGFWGFSQPPGSCGNGISLSPKGMWSPGSPAARLGIADLPFSPHGLSARTHP